MSTTNGKTSQGIGPGGNQNGGGGNPGQGGDQGNDPQTGPFVTIFVDNDTPREIHRGSQTIADIKTLGGVAQADQLQFEKPDGGLEKLDQNGRFTIKGGERFVSFRATGAAS